MATNTQPIVMEDSVTGRLIDVAWEKKANGLIEKMSDIKLLDDDEKNQMKQLIFDMIGLSELDYIKKFLNQCQEIKKIDSSMFVQNYDDLLFQCFLNCCLYSEKFDSYQELLASDLINLHNNSIGSKSYNLVFVASMRGHCDLLTHLIEKGVSFTHQSKERENIFHTLGFSDYSKKSSMSLQCLDYLMNKNEKVKKYLIKTNYEMLWDIDEVGLCPIVNFLKRRKPELALFIINQLSNFDVLKKIQQQLNVYSSENHLSDCAVEVIEKLNEKMIKHEKDTLNTVISAIPLTHATQKHKI